MMRPDENGPYVVWIDYGYEGWRPISYDTIEEAVAHKDNYTIIITKVVKYEVKEKE